MPGQVDRLHVITDTRGGRDPLPVITAALKAGARTIQVRHKEGSDLDLYNLAGRVADLCETYGATCLVNDRPDIAYALGLHGVHVGIDDIPVAAAATVLGSDRVIGATARSASRARAAEADGAWYLGAGPAFSTATKLDGPQPIGIPGISAIASAVRIPVIAIAGVTALRIPTLLAAGAYGVAVVSTISDAPDPHRATEELLSALGGP